MAIDVLLHKKASKELKNLESNTRNRIAEAIKEMKDDPFLGDVVPIEGLQGTFRRRVGNYRVVFSVDLTNNTVLVLRIAHRSVVYKGF